MLFKSADDKTHDVTVLEGLLRHPQATGEARQAIAHTLHCLQAEIRAQELAAAALNARYGSSLDWVLLHDVRLNHVGRMAQLHHVLIHRCLDMWVCDSNHFADGLAMDEFGACSGFFAQEPYGVPSPLEHAHKQSLVAQALMEEWPFRPRRWRVALPFAVHHVVLLADEAPFYHPAPNEVGQTVLRLSAFHQAAQQSERRPRWPRWRQVTRDTLYQLAMYMLDQHCPQGIDWATRFNLSQDGLVEAFPESTTPTDCAQCGVPVDAVVLIHCRAYPRRFLNQVLCPSCQRHHRRRAEAL